MAALTTTNVQKDYFGTLKVMYGEFSASAADAATTLAVEGGRVYLASFRSEDAAPLTTGVTPWNVPFSVSTSGATTTITVYANGKVTAGRFLIIYK